MKLRNSLKFRILVIFTALIIVLYSISSFMAVRAIIDTSSDVLISQGKKLTMKASEVIDGDSFEALVKSGSGDMTSPFFVETQAALLELKQNFDVLYLYTMAPVNGSTYMHVIDGSAPIDSGDDFSALGTREDTSEYDPAFTACWETKQVASSKPDKQGDWGWLVSSYAPIVNSSGEMVGIVGCDFEAGDLMNSVRKKTFTHTAIAVIFVVIDLVLMIIFMNLIFNRINAIRFRLKEISSGAGDLTQEMTVDHHDEISEMASYFNLTLKKIRGLVITIKNETVNLFDVGNQLAEDMDETAGTVVEMNSQVQHIKDQITDQSSSVTETNATMTRVSGNIETLDGNVKMQTESVARSSSAIEEMLANIRSVTETLVKNAENVNELISSAGEGRNGLEGVSLDIKEIARESEGILEINAVMQNIASQTNLLSMNAAIEAAHAGEAGKGFAVVAGEIRKLAENSSAQSKIISGVLKKIKSSIDKITLSTDTVLEKFQTIDQGIRIVSDQEMSIRNAMEKQGAGSQRILEAVSKMNELTEMVKRGSGEMAGGSKEVINESENLNVITNEISTAMTEMVTGVEHFNNVIVKVKEASSVNKQHINVLVKEISKFKVE